MDVKKVQEQVARAMQLIAEKSDLGHTFKADFSNGVLSFDIVFNERSANDEALVKLYQEPKMVWGHESYKRRYPGLTDDMIGRRFKLFNGGVYIYLGCITKRPTYPVSLIEVSKGNRMIKAPKQALTDMIGQMVTIKEEEKKVANDVDRFAVDIEDGGLF